MNNTVKNILLGKSYFLLVCIMLLLNACTNTNNQVSNASRFSSNQVLTPTITYIDGCSKQLDLVLLDKFYVVQNDVEGGQKQLSVYERSTNRYLYAFAVKGHGPNEVIALDMLQNPHGDTLEIIDQAKYKVFKYLLRNDKATLIGVNNLKMKAAGPLQEIYRHNDSILVFNTLDGRLQTYNDKKCASVFIYDFRDSLGIDAKHRDLVDYNFAYFNQQLCIGFRHMNCLLKGRVKDDGTIVVHDIEKVKGMINSASKDMFYYSYLSMNNKYILAQFMGYELGFISKMRSYKDASFKFELEIYNSNLEPIKHITSRKDILRCKLDVSKSSFYSWNLLDSKENILSFDF